MIAVIAYSRTGCETAQKVVSVLKEETEEEFSLFAPERIAEAPFSPISKPFPDFYAGLFRTARALIFIGSVGIAVREIAPHLRSKALDPAVISIDELGHFVIPILSGHIGGANALAQKIGDLLGAAAVITTATDINHRFSVDAWAAANGYIIDSLKDAKAVSAAILEGDVPICSDFPLPEKLPAGTYAGSSGKIGIYIGYHRNNPFDATLHLIPKVLQLGIGCRRGTSAEAISNAVQNVLSENGIYKSAVCAAASIDLKMHEDGLLQFCREKGLPIRFYSAAELNDVPGEFSGSEFVSRITGVDNVCERAAMIGAEKIIVKKCAGDGVTAALAQKAWEVSF